MLVILGAALVWSSLLLGSEAPALAGWQLGLGLLYPLQLTLNLVALARLSWPSLKSWPGDVEVELSVDRLRQGLRCGPLWIDSKTLPVARIQRLLVVKRRESRTIIWELVAERDDDSRMVVLGADDPGNVIPVATDLHARLAQRVELRDRWPPLVEEDRTDEAEPDRPLPSLLPGGAATWMALHVAGAAGLWQIGTLAWRQAPRLVSHTVVPVALAILQGIILLGNLPLVLAKRGTPSGGGTRPQAAPRAKKDRLLP